MVCSQTLWLVPPCLQSLYVFQKYKKKEKNQTTKRVSDIIQGVLKLKLWNASLLQHLLVYQDQEVAVVLLPFQ